MKKILLIFSLFALLASCDKPFEMDLPLSVAQRNISLTKDAGSTHVLVYADGDWTATFTEQISWASLNKVSGSGNSDLVFTYSANYGINRKVGIVLQKDNLREAKHLGAVRFSINRVPCICQSCNSFYTANKVSYILDGEKKIIWSRCPSCNSFKKKIISTDNKSVCTVCGQPIKVEEIGLWD